MQKCLKLYLVLGSYPHQITGVAIDQMQDKPDPDSVWVWFILISKPGLVLQLIWFELN